MKSKKVLIELSYKDLFGRHLPYVVMWDSGKRGFEYFLLGTADTRTLWGAIVFASKNLLWGVDTGQVTFKVSGGYKGELFYATPKMKLWEGVYA